MENFHGGLIHGSLGVSEFLLGTLEGKSLSLADFVQKDEEFPEYLRYIPAGQRAMELANQISQFYEDLESDTALVFQLLEAALRLDLGQTPDYVFLIVVQDLQISQVCVR